MTRVTGWLAIVLIGSLIITLIPVHVSPVCVFPSFKGQFLTKDYGRGRSVVRNAERRFAVLNKFYVSLSAVAFSVLGHRCRSKEAKKLPTSDEEHIFAADTCGVANDIRLTLMQRFFKDVGVYKI